MMTAPNDLIARLSEAAEGCDSHEFVGLLACDLRAVIVALQSAEAMREAQTERVAKALCKMDGDCDDCIKVCSQQFRDLAEEALGDHHG